MPFGDEMALVRPLMEPSVPGLRIPFEAEISSAAFTGRCVLSLVRIVEGQAVIVIRVPMLEDKISRINDHAGLISTEAELVVRVDPEIFRGKEFPAKCFKPRPGKNRHAKQIIDPATVTYFQDAGFENIAEALDNFPVPVLQGHPIVRHLDENITPTRRGRQIPGRHASLAFLGHHHMTGRAKPGQRFRVIAVKGENVLHRLRVKGCFKPSLFCLKGAFGAASRRM